MECPYRDMAAHQERPMQFECLLHSLGVRELDGSTAKIRKCVVLIIASRRLVYIRLAALSERDLRADHDPASREILLDVLLGNMRTKLAGY